ncbi:ABC transporter substrate-binding protein [Streptomyces sp. P1-3]|uniref:ABC transporter substrate-binding protein n=1 Tax=Streptomyces sp. P1-3 TaxID=3421658 RepID=UPI003D35F780
MPERGRGLDGGFLPGDGVQEFVAAFKRAVVPEDPRAKGRDVLPPVVLLVEGDDAAERAGRVVRGLEWCLRGRGAKLVPYARVGAGDMRTAAGAGRPLALAVGAGLTNDVPRRTGRLRLPDFWLMRDVVELGLGGPAAPLTGEALRDHCYGKRRLRGRVLRTLWALGGPGGDGRPGGEGGAGGDGGGGQVQASGRVTLALQMVVRPLTQLLPRWWWGRRRTRRLLWSKKRGWYADWRDIGHGRRSVEFFDDVAQWLESVGPLEPEAAAVEFELLLLRALLVDLKAAARPGRLSPWRRRRRTRFAVLLELPDGRAAGAGKRFLAEYGPAVEETGCAAVVVVAVGPVGSVGSGGSADSAPAGERCSGPADAASRLDHAAGMPDSTPEPLLAPLPGSVPSTPSGGRRVSPVAPRTFRIGPATELLMEGVVCVALLAGLLLPMGLGGGGGSAACLGGATGGSAPAARPPRAPSPKEQYDKLMRMIDSENARVARRRHGTFRTVIHVGASVAGNREEERFDGAIPELRGIVLAQRELNNEALSDHQKVWLRVEHRDAGERFKDAVDVAEGIVRQAERNPNTIGVVGFAESRTVTQEAVRVLGDAGIPMVGTTATADQMQVSRYYRPMAPSNSRETRIEGEFAHRARIMEDASGGCAPAEAAVVIQDPLDVYSKGLGDGFAETFGRDRWHKLWYSPDAPDGSGGGSGNGPDTDRVSRKETIRDVAEAVCERITQRPRTVVFWAARAREFTAFLNDFGDNTSCEGRKLTVLGGNELTNAALSGEYQDRLWPRSWLRLYHSAHVLPAGHPRSSDTAKEFTDIYARQFGKNDLWRDDGHAALAFDAMQLIAAAANKAYAGTDGRDVSRSNVQSSLYNGIRKEGASGYLDFGQGGRTVSRDKPLVIVHHTGRGSEPVLYCGAFAQNTGRITKWGPGGEFACPRDS